MTSRFSLYLQNITSKFELHGAAVVSRFLQSQVPAIDNHDDRHDDDNCRDYHDDQSDENTGEDDNDDREDEYTRWHDGRRRGRDGDAGTLPS